MLDGFLLYEPVFLEKLHDQSLFATNFSATVFGINNMWITNSEMPSFGGEGTVCPGGVSGGGVNPRLWMILRVYWYRQGGKEEFLECWPPSALDLAKAYAAALAD